MNHMVSQAENKPVYVVFGASGGIGSALSRRLASKGAQLVLAGRNSERVEALAGEMGAEPAKVDVEFPDQVDACFQRAIETYGRVDGAANCVGSLLLKPAHITTDKEWSATIATNLTSSFFVLRAGARAMMKSGGSIVLVSTAAARIGISNHEAIAASKAGVIGLMLAGAASYASRGIRMNCVAPGLVDTPLTSRITGNESALKASTAMHALGRIGKPEDIAGAIEWLLDPANNWITGQVIGVDGGLSSVHSRS
jgi:NAD(P)-dependent dehydrogenase (short-subunit alcohol dehydrogenase family)